MPQLDNPTAWMTHFNQAVQDTTGRMGPREVSLETALDELGELLDRIKSNRSRVWWIGNGGSAALCAHLAQDMLNKMEIPSQLCSDPALLTCMANDYGYERVYARPLALLAREGDLLVAISSSGASANILVPAQWALDNGLHLVTLSGFEEDNPLWGLDADFSFHVPSHSYGTVEFAHGVLLHSIIETRAFTGEAGVAYGS